MLIFGCWWFASFHTIHRFCKYIIFICLPVFCNYIWGFQFDLIVCVCSFTEWCPSICWFFPTNSLLCLAINSHFLLLRMFCPYIYFSNVLLDMPWFMLVESTKLRCSHCSQLISTLTNLNNLSSSRLIFPFRLMRMLSFKWKLFPIVNLYSISTPLVSSYA